MKQLLQFSLTSVGTLQIAVEGGAASQGGKTPLSQKRGVKMLENYEGAELQKMLFQTANTRLRMHLSLYLAGSLGRKVTKVPQIDAVTWDVKNCEEKEK